jgi:hypothetical protein
MRRVIVIAATGLSLAGCSSWSPSSPAWDVFKPSPPVVQIRLESSPPGADARTSLGPTCKTPCTIPMTVPDTGLSFSVTYTLNQFLPVTVPVKVTYISGDFLSSGTARADPNPVVAALQPVPPPPPPPKRKIKRKTPRPPGAVAAPPPPPTR